MGTLRIPETFRPVMRKTALTLVPLLSLPLLSLPLVVPVPALVLLLPPAPLLPLLRVRLRAIVSAPGSLHRRAPARRA